MTSTGGLACGLLIWRMRTSMLLEPTPAEAIGRPAAGTVTGGIGTLRLTPIPSSPGMESSTIRLAGASTPQGSRSELPTSGTGTVSVSAADSPAAVVSTAVAVEDTAVKVPNPGQRFLAAP